MRLARARSTIRSFMGMLAFLAADPSAAQSEAPIMRHAAMEESDDLPKADVAKPSLPRRALLRIGTDDLRTPGTIRSFAISPGGRLVAAGRPPSPRIPAITIFDVQTGRRVKQLVGPGIVRVGSTRPRSRRTVRSCSGANCRGQSPSGTCRPIGCSFARSSIGATFSM